MRAGVSSSVSLANIELHKIHLMNLAGIFCQKITILDSVFKDSDILTGMESSGVGKLVLNNVTGKGESLYLYADEMSILSSTDIKMDDEITVKVKGLLNITDSSLTSDTKLSLLLARDTSMNNSNSHITA